MSQSANLGYIVPTGISAVGLMTGLNFEILLAGFAGGLTSLSYLPDMTVGKRFMTLVSSTLTAAYMAPALTGKIDSVIENTGHPSSALFTAFVFGLVAQVIIPGMFKLAQNIMSKYIAKTE